MSIPFLTGLGDPAHISNNGHMTGALQGPPALADRGARAETDTLSCQSWKK